MKPFHAKGMYHRYLKRSSELTPISSFFFLLFLRFFFFFLFQIYLQQRQPPGFYQADILIPEKDRGGKKSARFSVILPSLATLLWHRIAGVKGGNHPVHDFNSFEYKCRAI